MGGGTPTRRGGRKPFLSVFAQVKAAARYSDDPAPTSKIFTIFEGTSEIQRMLIGRAVTGLDVR
jgi:alkylation response protein AidB-like acyl-CoA dehydrogenase